MFFPIFLKKKSIISVWVLVLLNFALIDVRLSQRFGVTGEQADLFLSNMEQSKV